MAKTNTLIFIFSLLLLLLLSNIEAKNLKLELVQVLFRHGDRYPRKTELLCEKPDKFDWISKDFDEFEQLTKKGMQREYRLGQKLRELYNDFLGDFKYSELYARSTSKDRTKMSLQLVLAGLYPPSEKTFWSNEIYWTPIPFDFQPPSTDFLNMVYKHDCMRNGALYFEAQNSTEIKKRLENYVDLKQKVEQNTIIKDLKPLVANVYHTLLTVLKSLEKPLPEWLTEQDFKRLREMTDIYFDTLTHTNLMRKMMSGPTIEQMLKNIQENQEKKRKIILYSAHDTNVGAFLKSHNVTGVPTVPEFGSAVILEQLRDDDNQVYIQMLYWTGVSEKLIPIKLEYCEEACLLTKYYDLVKSIIPNNEEKECFTGKKVEKS